MTTVTRIESKQEGVKDSDCCFIVCQLPIDATASLCILIVLAGFCLTSQDSVD